MALIKKTSSKPPENAVILTKREAIRFQWNQILGWKNYWDTWAFRFGLGILPGAAAIASQYILHHHRRKLKLRDYGYITSMFAVMFLPAVSSAALHAEFITNDILLFKSPCPLCVQTRAAALQICSGIIYPLLFSPITCSMLAVQGGIRIPHISQKVELMKMWWKYTKNLALPLTILVGLQVITATGLTYFEIKQLYELHEILLANPQKVIYSKESC